MSPAGPQRVSHKKTSFECWSQDMRSWYKEIRNSHCEATLPLRLLRTGRWRRRGAEGRDSPQHVPPTGEEVTHTGVERWLSPRGCGTESQGCCHSGPRRGGRKTVGSSSLRPEDGARCEQGWLLLRPWWRSVSRLVLRSWWSAGDSWGFLLGPAPLQSLPPASLCVSTPNSPSFYKDPRHWTRTHPDPVRAHLHLMASAWLCFNVRPDSWVPGVRTWTYLLRGHNSTHSTYLKSWV